MYLLGIVSDINLSKVSYQIQLIDQWLKRNELTLNYLKTGYVLFNKQPHVQVYSKFRIYVSKSFLKRVNTVKYLGVWIDDKLNWLAHIESLSLQLAQSCTIFFYLRDFMTDILLECCIKISSIVILFKKSQLGVLPTNTNYMK